MSNNMKLENFLDLHHYYIVESVAEAIAKLKLEFRFFGTPCRCRKRGVQAYFTNVRNRKKAKQSDCLLCKLYKLR